VEDAEKRMVKKKREGSLIRDSIYSKFAS